MKTTIGEKGLKNSWQGGFPKTTKCYKCGKTARICFVTYDDERPYLCNLHSDKSRWFHDLCSVAVYLCKECSEMTVIWDQT